MNEEEAVAILRERRDWLAEEIDHRTRVGQDATHDRRELEALTWAIRRMSESDA